MKLGEIIKKFRDEHKLSMDKFAEQSGLTKGYISMLEKNEHPKSKKPIIPTEDTLIKVAKGMGVDIEVVLNNLDENQEIQINTSPQNMLLPSEELLRIDRELKEPRHSVWISHGEELLAEQVAEENTVENSKDTVDNNVVSLDNYRKRVNKSVPGKASAGTGYWQEDDYDTMVSFYEDEIPDDDDYDTIAIVVGHSMEPKIKNGDFLFIKLTNSVDVNKIGIFQVDGDNYVKKLKNGYLESLNKDYDNIDFKDHDDIRTIGEVVEIYRER